MVKITNLAKQGLLVKLEDGTNEIRLKIDDGHRI
jgi:hypothetical protein